MDTPTPITPPFPNDILDRIQQLAGKYDAMGQDLRSYLDGLLYADYLTYWDYIRLDVLLSLQSPLTQFPDETIFIIYHQITELYFKLVLHAMQQIAEKHHLTTPFFLTQLKRINSYFSALIHSFDIMIDGMDKHQFLKFRMSLLPASGFQSAQYRLIELGATDIHNLLLHTHREKVDTLLPIAEKYPYLYWRRGAMELATGKKTLTLRQFEAKYKHELIRFAEHHQLTNLWVRYKLLSPEAQQNEALIVEMRRFDLNANVYWPLMHYKSAVRYLQQEPKDIAATGGTNWQKYLPPKNQFVIFYPELWTAEEKASWGKRIQEELFK